MGTSSFQQADSLVQSRKRQSFTLPHFRLRSSASAGDEQQEVARSAEEAARVQKAAAWQWYTGGMGTAVVPTKRPLISKSQPSQAPIDPKNVVDGRSKAGESKVPNKTNVPLQKKPLEPPLAQSPRAALRFESEASFTRPSTSATPSAPSAARPATPSLYDEFELDGLRSQMANLVQRLQHHQTKDNEPSSAVADHQNKAKPLHSAFDGGSVPAAASVSTDHAAMANYHQLTKPLPPSAALVPFGMRPLSALHRLFRKVVSGSIIKSTKNSPVMMISSSDVYEPEVFPGEEGKNNQYHFHHHHHHYHYGQSPEESAAILCRSRRRYSESSGIRPLILTPCWEEESSDEEEESIAERSPIELAYLARRRRRHSDSIAEHLTPKKAAFNDEEEMKGSSVKLAALPLQYLPRRYNSLKRFSPKKMDGKELAQPAALGGEDEFEEERIMDTKSRRHAVENGADLERKAERAGNGGRGTYKLGGAADGRTTANFEAAGPAKTFGGRRGSL